MKREALAGGFPWARTLSKEGTPPEVARRGDFDLQGRNVG